MPGLARSFSRTKRALGLSASFYRERAGGWPPAGASLAMDFTRPAYFAAQSSRTFDQLIDFTRTSSATYVDATGKIVSTPASRNLLTFTQEFDNAVWTKNNVTITTNSTAAPDGTLTAETLTASANAAVHIVTQAGGSSGVQQTFSVYAKAGTSSFVQLWHGAAASIYANFNVSTGVVGTVGAGATATISSAGNGWYRCTITCTPGLTNQFRAAMVTSTTAAYAESWTAVGTETVFIWGAQLEAGSTATDYTRNNGGVYPPRFDYDPVTLAPRGLLVEEQRTNLLVRSEEFDNASWTKTAVSVVANAATSPDGTVDADRLIGDTTATGHILTQVGVASAASGTTYTASVYLKAEGYGFAFVALNGTGYSTPQYISVNLSTGATAITNGTPTAFAAINSGNGWWRVIVTATTNVAAGTVQCDVRPSNDGVWANRNTAQNGTSGIFLYGAQLEAGAFATSYIPTVASQVTRTADVATITGANFSQWYNQSEGTFVVGYQAEALVSIDVFMANAGAPLTNSIGIYNTSGTNDVGWCRVAGGTQAAINGSVVATTAHKSAFAYATNNFAFSTAGGSVGTDTSGALPAPDRLTFGANNISSNSQGMWLRSLTYYNTRLPNAQLQALTS